jgi:hypothetical protein
MITFQRVKDSIERALGHFGDQETVNLNTFRGEIWKELREAFGHNTEVIASSSAVPIGNLGSGSNEWDTAGSPLTLKSVEDIHLNQLIAEDLLRYLSGVPNATQIKASKHIPGPEYWRTRVCKTISDVRKHALIIDKKAEALSSRCGPWNTQGFETSKIPSCSEHWSRMFLDDMSCDTQQDRDDLPIAVCACTALMIDQRRCQGVDGENTLPLFRLRRFSLLSRPILKRFLQFSQDRDKQPSLDLKAKDLDAITPIYLVIALPALPRSGKTRTGRRRTSLHSATEDDSTQGPISHRNSPCDSPCDSHCDSQCRKRPRRAVTDESSSSASSTPYSDVAQKIRRIGEDFDANSCDPRTSDGVANSANASALDCSPRDFQTLDMVVNEDSGFDCGQGSTAPFGSPCDSQYNYQCRIWPQGVSTDGFASSILTLTTSPPEEGLAVQGASSFADSRTLRSYSLALKIRTEEFILFPSQESDIVSPFLDSECFAACESEGVRDDVTGIGGGDAGKATASQVPALSGACG